MKTRILTLLAAVSVLSVLATASNVSDVSAQTVREQRTVRSVPVFDSQGHFAGTLETVVGQTSAKLTRSATNLLAASIPPGGTVYSRTCWVEVWLKNVFGQKVWSLKTNQTWRYDGYKVLNWDPPAVSASSQYGWSHSSPQSGVGWTNYPTAAKAWASSTFTYKVVWFTLESYSVYEWVDFRGNGACYTGAQW